MGINESVDILKSAVCRCGRAKKYRTAFCRDCYWKLPPAIRQALYAAVGCGFEQAYELAEECLLKAEGKS